MPNTSCENGIITKMFQLVSDQYSNSNVLTVQRKYFNETRGKVKYVTSRSPIISALHHYFPTNYRTQLCHDNAQLSQRFSNKYTEHYLYLFMSRDIF